MPITNQSPKRNNVRSGKKAKNDSRQFKIGRIRFNSWATASLRACDIVIYETELVHIHNRHGRELGGMGFAAFDFVKYIADNFNEVRCGTGNSVLLVVHREHTSNMAAIELVMDVVNGREVYKIKTASPISTKKLSLKKLLCANDRWH